ncbi:uncharacterized protein LOC126975227 [Leptidea sinapis]|uniref:Kazal-like domain-containing protein n=1 Tax=Leptidea sinapis TaxID=189913 RepID=A0A5E4Q174_9NEOP|nr:uncharacterized protein LOC126975227 [Leptidea sinapis]VVC92013.1 unnamed protein product [Leptidea sinapis]
MDSSALLVVILSIVCQATAFSWFPHFHDKWLSDFSDFKDNDVLDNDKIYFPDDDDRWQTTSTTMSPDTTARTDIQIVTCMNTCPMTLDYNPVCASDGVTFQNIGHLLCAVKCGIDVRIERLGACPKPEGLKPTVSQKRLKGCMAVCPTTSDDNPVCGTDNVTYKNEESLYCAKMCGAGVDLKRKSRCSSTITTTTIAPNKNVQIQNCISGCPVTSEYNPVCGSNYVTYKNIGMLQCANSCGIDVNVLAHTACFLLTTTPPPSTQPAPQDSLPTTTTQSTANTIPQEILDSIFKKPDNDEIPNIDPRSNPVKE